MMPLVPADDKSSLMDEHNRVVYRDAGNTDYPAQVIWRAPSSQTAYILDADNASGKHANFGSGVLVVEDAGVTVGGGAVLLLPDGSTGSPALKFTSDPNTGIRWVSADRWAAVAGAADVFQVANVGATFGLGIGVAPSVALTVSRSVADYIGEFTNANAGGRGITVATGGTSASDPIVRLTSNSVERFAVMADGTIKAGGLEVLKVPLTAKCSSALTLAVAAADITGCSLTLTPGNWTVIGVFAMSCTNDATQVLSGSLVTSGGSASINSTATAQFSTPNATGVGTVAQTWVVQVAATTTAKLQGSKSGGAGTSTAGLQSTITAIG